MVENNYWTYDDYFIFKPEFNGSITNYLNILIKYKKLIFSDFDQKVDIKTIINKNYNQALSGNSKFNQPLSNTLDQLSNLTHIDFSSSFNHLIH
jgi:hypothetical protein